MARQTKTYDVVTDDLTGEEVPEDEAQNIQFSYGGNSYEIDLSKKNAKKLDDFLATYIDAARKVRPTPTGKKRSLIGDLNEGRKFNRAEVAEWAKANGYEVAERGRIPAAVTDAYVQAGN